MNQHPQRPLAGRSPYRPQPIAAPQPVRGAVACQRCGAAMEKKSRDVYGGFVSFIGMLIVVISLIVAFYSFLGMEYGTLLVALFVVVLGVFLSRTQKIWRCPRCRSFFERA